MGLMILFKKEDTASLSQAQQKRQQQVQRFKEIHRKRQAEKVRKKRCYILK